MTEYQLTPEERAAVDEMIAEAQALQTQANGAIRVIAKLHGVQGDLSYADGFLRTK